MDPPSRGTSSSSRRAPTRGRRRPFAARGTRDWGSIRATQPSSTPQTPRGSSSNDQTTTLDIATIRARNRSRFSKPPAPSNTTPNAATPPTNFVKRGTPKPASYYEPRLRPKLVGTGRATGLSRTPDPYFIDSASRIGSRLQTLQQRVANLEAAGRTVISATDITPHAFASDATVEEWDDILAQFRALTMAMTASKDDTTRALARDLYEGAADAALFGGNLGFYLSCQSRLLRDIYPSNDTKTGTDARHAEFTSYALLYFGVFAPNRCELVQLMRGMSAHIIRRASIKFAFEVIQAYRHHDGFRYIAQYTRASVRQRTLMSPKLPRMRRHGMLQIVKAYLKLEKDVAHGYLSIKTEGEFVELLKDVRPDLADVNAQQGENYRFRVAR